MTVKGKEHAVNRLLSGQDEQLSRKAGRQRSLTFLILPPTLGLNSVLIGSKPSEPGVLVLRSCVSSSSREY